MAMQYNVNTIVSGLSEALYISKTVAKLAGFTVPKSSDGTTYNSSGDQITGFGTGANGMNNNLAWFIIREPSSGRAWCVQRASANNYSARVKYSRSGDFTGGSPSATVTPSATDEQILLGGGTDASPTFSQMMTNGGGDRWHAIAYDAAVNGVYEFYFTANGTPGYNARTTWANIALAAGSYHPSDTDPSIQRCYYGASNAWTYTSQWKYWHRYGLSGAVWVANTQAQGLFGTALPQYDSEFQRIPLLWGQATYGWKGASHRLMCNPCYSQAGYEYPSTVDLATNALLIENYVSRPWPNSVTPLL